MTFVMLPLRRLGEVVLGKMIQPEPKSQTDVAAPYLRAAHVQPDGRIIDVDDKTMWFTSSELAHHDLRSGDVVIVEGGAGYGRSATIRESRPGWGFQNSIIRVRPHLAKSYGPFIDYSLQSALAAGAIEVACFTATIPHFTADKVGAFRIPAPSYVEQRAIADFLDRETARIDTLIEEQERLIELLRERRQALVETALTVVRPITEGQRLKHVTLDVRQGWSPQCYAWPADGIDTWAVLKAGAVNGGVFRPNENKELPASETARTDTVVSRGQLVVSRANTRELAGSAAVVDADYPRLMLSDKLYGFALDRARAVPEFVSLVLGTQRWRSLIELEATGSSPSMQNISQADILNPDFRSWWAHG